MDSEARTRDSRARAEEALVRFALLAGSHSRDFVVIGGLNPDFLVPQPPAPHLGTTDVDLLFDLGFVYDRDELDFGWLDVALGRAQFEPNKEGWRWDALLGDLRVRLDLLCDVADHPGQAVVLPGANDAAAQNLSGPAPALESAVTRRLRVPAHLRRDHPDAPTEVALRFASLGGYLAAKSAALVKRRKPKDAYDLMFVALYNPGRVPGAADAVGQLHAPPHREAPLIAVREAMNMIASDARWAGHFADQARQAGDEEDHDLLVQDATRGARRFLSLLESSDQSVD